MPEEKGSIAAVGVAQLEEHQFGAGVELHAEPVPALLIGFQLVGEPLVVHPRGAGDGARR